MKSLRMIGLATLAALVPGLAMAEGQWTLGLGAGGANSIYENQKDEATALPFLSFQTGRFSIGLDGISYRAVETESFSLAFALAPGEAPDVKEFAKRDARFAGLDRDTPVELGFNATYQTGMLQFGASVMQDVASASEGYHAEATAGVSVPVGAGLFDIGVGARLRDAKTNNFLYGVSTAEANGLRPAYNVGSTVQPFLTGSLVYPITEKASLVGFFEYEKLDDKVTRSPLVRDNEDASYGAGFGVVFTF
jgi:MipA family protein